MALIIGILVLAVLLFIVAAVIYFLRQRAIKQSIIEHQLHLQRRFAQGAAQATSASQATTQVVATATTQGAVPATSQPVVATTSQAHTETATQQTSQVSNGVLSTAVLATNASLGTNVTAINRSPVANTASITTSGMKVVATTDTSGTVSENSTVTSVDIDSTTVTTTPRDFALQALQQDSVVMTNGDGVAVAGTDHQTDSVVATESVTGADSANTTTDTVHLVTATVENANSNAVTDTTTVSNAPNGSDNLDPLSSSFAKAELKPISPATVTNLSNHLRPGDLIVAGMASDHERLQELINQSETGGAVASASSIAMTTTKASQVGSHCSVVEQVDTDGTLVIADAVVAGGATENTVVDATQVAPHVAVQQTQVMSVNQVVAAAKAIHINLISSKQLNDPYHSVASKLQDALYFYTNSEHVRATSGITRVLNSPNPVLGEATSFSSVAFDGEVCYAGAESKNPTQELPMHRILANQGEYVVLNPEQLTLLAQAEQLQAQEASEQLALQEQHLLQGLQQDIDSFVAEMNDQHHVVTEADIMTHTMLKVTNVCSLIIGYTLFLGQHHKEVQLAKDNFGFFAKLHLGTLLARYYPLFAQQIVTCVTKLVTSQTNEEQFQAEKDLLETQISVLLSELRPLLTNSKSWLLPKELLRFVAFYYSHIAHYDDRDSRERVRLQQPLNLMHQVAQVIGVSSWDFENIIYDEFNLTFKEPAQQQQLLLRRLNNQFIIFNNLVRNLAYLLTITQALERTYYNTTLADAQVDMREQRLLAIKSLIDETIIFNALPEFATPALLQEVWGNFKQALAVTEPVELLKNRIFFNSEILVNEIFNDPQCYIHNKDFFKILVSLFIAITDVNLRNHEAVAQLENNLYSLLNLQGRYLGLEQTFIEDVIFYL